MGITLHEFYLCRYMHSISEIIEKIHASAYQRGRMRAFHTLHQFIRKHSYECSLFIHPAYIGRDDADPLIYYEVVIYNHKKTSRSFSSRYYYRDELENRLEIYDKMCDLFNIHIRYVYSKEEKLVLSNYIRRYTKILHLRICKTCERLCREHRIKNSVIQKEYPRIMQFRETIVCLFLKIHIPGLAPKTFRSEYYEKNTLKCCKDVYLKALATVSAEAIQYISLYF